MVPRIQDFVDALGVRGRTSDNRLIREKLGWAPSQPLEAGLRKAYAWIARQVELGASTPQGFNVQPGAEKITIRVSDTGCGVSVTSAAR